MKNLKSRGIKYDMQRERCGTEYESINHVFFECSPAIHTWAFSRVPTSPDNFPMQLV